MTNRFSNKNNMYKAVRTVCTERSASWQQMPAFSYAFSAYTGKLDDLKQAMYDQQAVMLGVKDRKDALRKATIKKSEIIANILRAYAAASDNAVLKESMCFSVSDQLYNNTFGTMLLLNRTAGFARKYEEELLQNGVTNERIKELENMITELGNAFQAVRSAMLIRMSSTTAISVLVAEIDSLLKNQLDLLVKVVDDPEFEVLYKSARVIVHQRGKKNKKRTDPGELPAEDQLSLPDVT